MANRQSQDDPAQSPADEVLETLAADFVERIRRGERPSIAEYEAEQPELAEDIRDLFPTIAMMEGVKTPIAQLQSGRPAAETVVPDRLGDFRIIREIGRGGMGIVYEAEQESLGRTVAVKVLPNSALLDEKNLQRFKREARTAAGLHHTNIVPVFGVGEQDGLQYYVMQYIDGAGLDRILPRLREAGSTACLNLGDITRDLHAANDSASRPTIAANNRDATTVDGQPQTEQEEVAPSVEIAQQSQSRWQTVAELGIQVADALEYAHGKGVLHRDIKPANLIIDSRGVVWVADFGLAKAFEQDDVSRTGDVLGTPAYMAPEQLHGRTNNRSDIYSLGLTLYELLTLRPAFEETDQRLLLKRIAAEQPPNPRKIRPEIPRDLETIVLKAIAHEPKRRYRSAADLKSDLQCYLEDRPIRARRITSVERFWRWCRRNPVVAGLSTAVAALLVLIATTASIGYARTSRALAGERDERQRAEAATNVAIEVLDRIYERFSLQNDLKTGDGAEQSPFQRPALSAGTAAVLEDLLVFYDRLAEQSGGDDEYLEKVALANRRVGDIRHHLDQLDKAATAYRRSLQLYAKLDEASGEKSHNLEMGLVQVELGIVLSRLGKREQAEESWKAAAEMLAKPETDETREAKRKQAVERANIFLSLQGDFRLPSPPGPRGDDRPPIHPPRVPFPRPPLGPDADLDRPEPLHPRRNGPSQRPRLGP